MATVNHGHRQTITCHLWIPTAECPNPRLRWSGPLQSVVELVVRGGAGLPTFRFSGAYVASLHVAGRRLIGQLAAQTMAGCGPVA